jgi:hypothetical protein
MLLGLALAGSVLVAGPAEAVPTPPAAPTFQIGIVADEGPAPASGSRLTFDAALVSGETAVDGVEVTLTARPYGATAFTTIGHGTTAADGTVSVAARLATTARIRWVFAGDDEHAATTSADYVRTIGRKVSARALDRSLTKRQKVVVVGRANPKKAGLAVSLWRGDIPCFCQGTSSSRIAVGRIRPDGTFRLTARFARAGTKKLFVKVNAGAGNDTGYSRYLVIKVR